MSSELTLVDLARRARDAVADGRDATLLIAGLGRLTGDDVTIMLYDHDGRPTFVCPSDSPITTATGSPAMLTVTAPPVRSDPDAVDVGPSRMTAILTGRLAPVRGAGDQPGVTVVGLVVEDVVLEYDDPAATNVTQRHVPLDLYLEVESYAELSHAAALVHHVNEGHQDELRGYAAWRAGLSPDEVAGVALSSLSRHGARFTWIDTSGGHVGSIRFEVPVEDLGRLGVVLREHLIAVDPEWARADPIAEDDSPSG